MIRRRTTSAVITLSAVLLLATPVLAESSVSVSVTNEGNASSQTTVHTEVNGKSETIVTRNKELRVTASSGADLKVRMTNEKADFLAKRKTFEDEFKDRMKKAREEWASKAAELKDRLKEIKDTRKQKIVENVDQRISDRNENWVTHWNEVLKRLSSVLDKVQTKSDEASKNGKDVTSVTTAITAGRSAIAAAQSAINTQAGKTYTITINSDDTLGKDVSATLSSFHSDVVKVINSINDARRAVVAALQALGKVLGKEVPTISPIPSPAV